MFTSWLVPQLTLWRADSNRCGAQFDGLNGILHLEEAALRREGVHASVVLGSGEKHAGL